MPKLPEYNELLRSAYQIAERQGGETNWEAFKKKVRAELFEQAGLADLNDEQTVLRVTCTARTYRMVAGACDDFKADEEDPMFCVNCYEPASHHKGPTPGAPRDFRR